MKTNPYKKFAGIAINALLFFVLGSFVSIPSPVPTVNICVQYGLLAYVAVTIGPLAGTLTGLFGHMLIDLYAGEFCWSWILASAAFGGLLGILADVVKLNASNRNLEMLIRFNLCQVAVHVVCWAGVAPVLEILLYSESMDKIFEQGLTAGIANSVTTAVVGSLLLVAHMALTPKQDSTPKA